MLAVVPYNLIPCCSDCNKAKQAEAPDSWELETIHSYHDMLDDAVWIKAEVIEEEPVASVFMYADQTPGQMRNIIEKKIIWKYLS